MHPAKCLYRSGQNKGSLGIRRRHTPVALYSDIPLVAPQKEDGQCMQVCYSPDTRAPFFSLCMFLQATPGATLPADVIDALTKRTMDGGTEVVQAKAGKVTMIRWVSTTWDFMAAETCPQLTVMHSHCLHLTSCRLWLRPGLCHPLHGLCRRPVR